MSGKSYIRFVDFISFKLDLSKIVGKRKFCYLRNAPVN